MMLALELAENSTREEILTVLRAPHAPDEAAVERVVTLMEQIGVREQAAQMVQEGFGRVEQAVEMALPAGQDGPIRELLARLRVRDY
jgi:hypothetical protein